ncbi:hypothetical protein CHS0354_013138 [Potamilus streckersoni]|uniref:Mechanosensitive ion channel MscS domain-containing protein n=1 Tax=Potamilus streckersoni TaxID=2493646 RepID=A0AAE0S6K6_9BIVA|nr:hypothetical protein CHS0354_013138 [Potamilus streckersoni]
MFVCRVVNPRLHKLMLKSQVKWDNFILEERIPQALSLIISSALVIGFFEDLTYSPEWIKRLLMIWLLALFMVLGGRLINFLIRIYNMYPLSKKKPVKNLGQLMKIGLAFIIVILGVSVLSGKSPLLILSGIGAVSAFIAFIFKDTLLAFIAGLQVAAMDMIRIGDWVEVPQYSANGQIIEISLYTIKIENWDKSISFVPLNKAFETNVKNWRYIQETGGRKVKKLLFIDISSVHFLKEEDYEVYRQEPALQDYITAHLKKNTPSVLNTDAGNTEDNKISRIRYNKQLTNLALFRVYIRHYLKQHPDTRKDLSIVVAQSDTSDTGIPLEIHFFLTASEWDMFENIQAEIFEYLISVAPEFGLTFPENREWDFISLSGTPWEIPGQIRSEVIRRCRSHEQLTGKHINSTQLQNTDNYKIDICAGEAELVVLKSFVRTEPLFIADMHLYIGKNTKLEFGALIRPYTYIGNYCEIRQGAYLRGNILVGDRCVVGHTTEIKNSALIYHTEAGHFNYIGDTVIGSYVNLGAGTVISNLNFRTLEQKKRGEFPPMTIQDKDGNAHKGTAKFGSLIGDGCETGCNSVLAPGTLLGRESAVYPCVFVRRKYYPPKSVIRK